MTDINRCRAEGVITFEVHNVSKIKETVLSEPVIIQNLYWRIMLMPRYSVNQSNEHSKSAGVFVQCDPESEIRSWSCQAHAKITLKSHKEEDLSRKISHLFFEKENDWGYSTFVPWNDLIDVHKGYIKNDIITLEAFVQAEAPHGVFWDSKKFTGYVGLKTQGATCYMNSLLQTLFFTNQLRKLLDNMEMKMKSTVVEGIIPNLLKGKMNYYVQCSNVNYYSSREEPFYDIQLSIKGKTDVIDSFREYTKTEILDGDNKYYTCKFGLQDAKKGVIFRHFPPVLHLHLLRFQYDPQTETNYKINDRYAFPESLNLEKFLEPEFQANAPPPIYTLHAVLVHSGDNHDDHYVVYINPCGDGKWFKFDDDVVSQATKKEAIENNYGGFEEERAQCSNAYMLSYLRTSDLKTILTDVDEDCIPYHLVSKFSEEKRLKVQRRIERSEAHLYMDVHIVTEDAFYKWSGNDLFDLNNNKTVNFKIQKKEKLCDATKIIAEAFGYAASQCRLWPFQKRANGTTRPASVELCNEDKRRFKRLNNIELFYANDQDPTMIAFLEMLSPDSDFPSLPGYDSFNEVILFFKFYNPMYKIISYCGHHYINLQSTPSSLFPMLCKRAGLPKGTNLLFYEEFIPGQTNWIEMDKKFDEVVHDLMNGDIICFQAVEQDLTRYELPTPVEYFKDLLHQVQVLFCDKTVPSDNGFVETLNLKMNYTQIANAAASTLGVDPLNIQFFKPQIDHPDQPGKPVKCSFDGHLTDLVCSGNKGPKKIYYQVEHRKSCKISPVNYVNQCDIKTSHNEVFSHTTDDCNLTIFPCQFFNIGCNFRGTIKEQATHTSSSTHNHLSMAISKVIALESKIASIKEETAAKIASLEKKVNSIFL